MNECSTPLSYPYKLSFIHITIAPHKYCSLLLLFSKSKIKLADSFKGHIMVCRVTAI